MAELLVNTRRKPLVKQPVVVRDPDHGIPPSSGIWPTTTRVHASPVSFVRGRRRKGWFVGTDDPSVGGWVAFYRNERIGVARPPCYSISRFASCLRIYNRTQAFHEISVGSLSRELRD